MPEGSLNVESNMLEIRVITAVPVEPEPEAPGAAVDVEPDMFEMKSATEEHQQQCHTKSAR
jgi:hypothetical protein